MFRRSLQLPQEVDEDDVSARFEDGVLEVVIEGAEGQEPKHVQVESSDGGGSKSQQEEGNGDQQR